MKSERFVIISLILAILVVNEILTQIRALRELNYWVWQKSHC